MKISDMLHRAAVLHRAYHREYSKWVLSLADPHLLPAIVVPMSKYAQHPMPPETHDELRNFLFSQPVAVLYALGSLREAGRPRHRWDFWKDYERLQKRFKKPDLMVHDLIKGDDLRTAFRHAAQKLARKGLHVDQLL
jgi:hypothetical protein